MDRNRKETREGVQEKKMQIVSKYRVATRQLFTFEMIHEKLLWVQDLNPTSVDRESRKLLFHASKVAVVAGRCHQTPLDLKVTTSKHVLVCSAFGEQSQLQLCNLLFTQFSYRTTQPRIQIGLLLDIRAERVVLERQEFWLAFRVRCDCRRCSTLLPNEPTKVKAPSQP